MVVVFKMLIIKPLMLFLIVILLLLMFKMMLTNKFRHQLILRNKFLKINPLQN
jgi:hypothetical protein